MKMMRVGLSTTEVESLMGNSKNIKSDERGRIVYEYPKMNVKFLNEIVVVIEYLYPAKDMEKLSESPSKCGADDILSNALGDDSNLTLNDFADYASPRPKRFVLYSLALGLLALIPLAVVVQAPYSIIKDFKRGSFELNPFILTFWLALFFLLWRLSKRFYANTRKMLLKDSRSPILYLRSFSLETSEESKRLNNLDAKPDETLTTVFKQVGPLIAIGKPGDTLSPLGATRLYFDHHKWKKNVEALMSFSKLVIIEANNPSKLSSTGIEWEISTTIKRLKPQQVIYSFLSWQQLSKGSRQEEYEVFVKHLMRIYGEALGRSVGLPYYSGNPYFMHFDQNWNPKLISLNGWKRHFFENVPVPTVLWKLLPSQLISRTSAASVREALRPILNKQGIKLPIWRTGLYIALCLGVIAVIFISILKL